MIDQPLACLVRDAHPTRPLYAVRPQGLAELLDSLPAPQAMFVRGSGFTAATQELALLPGPGGVEGAVLGLGADHSPYAFGDLAFRLPEGTPWRLEMPADDHAAAVLGFCLGAYRFEFVETAFRSQTGTVGDAGAIRTCRK